MFKISAFLTTNDVATGGVAGFIANYGIILIMIVIMVVMIYLPERKRKKQYNEMVSSMKVGNEVFTTSGIIGKITKIEESYIIMETGPDRVRIKLDKRGIHSITGKSEEKQEIAETKEKEK